VISSTSVGATRAGFPHAPDDSTIELLIQEHRLIGSLRIAISLHAVGRHLWNWPERIRITAASRSRSGGNATTVIACVDIYRRVEHRIFTLQDAEQFQLTVQAFGQQMAEEPTALRPNFAPTRPARIWLSPPRDSGLDRHAARLGAVSDAR
jgi:hypothetical protein